MNCPKCGTPAPEGTALCSSCNYVFPIGLREDGEPSVPGVPLPRAPARQPVAPTRPALGQQPAPQPKAAPAQQPAPQPQTAPAQQPAPQPAPALLPAQEQPVPAQPAAQPPPGGVVPGIITERSILTVILLGMVTCGFYVWWWWYKTTDELKQATGDESLNPGMDLLLVFLTGGIWGVYIEYRNTKKVNEILVQHDPGRKDQTQMVLIMRLVGLFIPITAFYAMYLAQEEYNAMARTFG